MHVLPKYLVALLCALLSTGLYADEKEEKEHEKGKWSGHVSLDGGSNFNKDEYRNRFSNNRYSGDFKIGYARSKWSVNALAGLSYNDNIKSTEGASFNFNEKKEKFLVDYSSTVSSVMNLNLGLDAQYNPSERNKIILKYSFSRKWNNPQNLISSLNLLTDPASLQSTEESTDGRKNIHVFEGKWNHRFNRRGRELEVTTSYENDIDKQYTNWTIEKSRMKDVGQTVPDEQTIYRYRPDYSDFYSRTGARFKERNFCNVDNLDMVFGLNLVAKLDWDNYRAEDLTQGQWVERERFTASYEYYSIQVDPLIHLKYSLDKIGVEAEFIPQYYTYSLSDATHAAKKNDTAPEMIGMADFFWNITEHHSVKIGVNRSISRPEYLQMCWFQRPGVYSNELYEGNSSLAAAARNKVFLNYKYAVGRFSTILDAEHTYAVGTIEQTFHNETLEGKDYRIYTWVNAGHSYTTKGSVLVKWSGKRLKADAKFNINWFRGFNLQNALTQSNDYNLAANVSFDFGSGWDAAASVRYQSDIKRNYTSMTEHVTGNMRVSKSFKHIEIFLEGLDLFEKPIEKTVVSLDMMEGRVEDIYFNRRIHRMGIKYKF